MHRARKQSRETLCTLVNEIKPTRLLILRVTGQSAGWLQPARDFNVTADVYWDTGCAPLKSVVCKYLHINTQSVGRDLGPLRPPVA